MMQSCFLGPHCDKTKTTEQVFSEKEAGVQRRTASRKTSRITNTHYVTLTSKDRTVFIMTQDDTRHVDEKKEVLLCVWASAGLNEETWRLCLTSA